MLDIIGLSEIDVDVYDAFAGTGSMTFAEIRKRTGVPKQRLLRVLRLLTEKGLLIKLPGPAEAYSAVRPEIGLEAMLRQKEQELVSARLVADRLRERYRATSGKRPVDLIEVIHGNVLIAERADQLLRSAEEEVSFVDKPPYAQTPSVLHPAERELLGRGVRFRGVYERSGLESHDLSSDLEAGLALGEEARVVTTAPLKMIVVDQRIGLIPLRSDLPEVDTALVIHPCALLDALSAVFAFLWQNGLPLRLPSSADQADVAHFDDARLLALLTTGLPDRSIAKQLGMSYRTFQRRLRDLMTALGATTRFQAGLQVATRGWVTLPETQPLSEEDVSEGAGSPSPRP
ncbi:helix-turn-helix domain-containing protein [Amycolatopsis umgeniensis]|uniref:DNA-binding Lrp family transcriptional regulator n=1 Tax=Amycolatopsis umgeniensis TaxID=336628 RepID=A0A841BFH9_9PSEU|nr:helix-turn-helix domain-containing protein [Amycolatopsis umgeniensis]MBB5857568.1 DNA-binding Lrp family transcriptional regulator [Amycolatopsis umgeniensis]